MKKFRIDLFRGRLAENLFSLIVLQAVNYILPLITIPHLVRVLGPDFYGLIAFSSAFIMYFSLISDYGFNLSATRQISIHRDDSEKVSKIFSSVIMVKFLILILCVLLLLVILFSFERLHKDSFIYLSTFGIVVGQVIFPVWLFQGLEEMKHVTYINLFVKSIFTLMIFAFVRDQSDYILVPIFNSFASILIGLISLYMVFYVLGYRFVRPRLQDISFQIRDGWHIFYSSIAISVYTVSTTVILGFLTNNATVGHFSAAEKIIQAVKSAYQPFSQALYPMIGRKINENKNEGLLIVSTFSKLIIPTMAILSFIIFIFAKEIVYIILGRQFLDSVEIIRIMSPLPFLVTASNILGIQIMLNLGLKSVFSIILTIAAIIGILLPFIVVPNLGGQGTAYVILFVESFVTISMYIYVRRYVYNSTTKE